MCVCVLKLKCVGFTLSFCPPRYGSREVIAYAASRLQGTYGATLRVLNEVCGLIVNEGIGDCDWAQIAVRDPSFHPETMLDFGSGLGTAVWYVVCGHTELSYRYPYTMYDAGQLIDCGTIHCLKF